MAVLTNEQLAELRVKYISGLTSVGITKPQLNAAVQAIEDWFEANRASLGAAIESAAPSVFNATEKKRLGKFWLLQKFGRE